MKLLKIKIFLLLVTFNMHVLYAQTTNLKGTVKDSIGKPVEMANVMLFQTKFSATTDSKGNYSIENILPGNYDVIVTLMGYNPISKKTTLKENETTELHFKLSHKINQLGEVTVNGVLSISGMGHLDEVHDGVIYSGKKNEVLILDSIDANTAQNNPRQVLGRVPGANYSETEGSGFPSNGIGFRGLSPVQSIETNTRQNGYNVTADLYGYPESYYLPPLEAIERIEVIRGASSLQFGPQFGGVINYITKNGPGDKPIEVTTQQTGGSYGLFNSFTSVGGTYKKWNYFSYVQYKGVQGLRPNSQLSQMLAFAKVEYHASDKFKIGMEYSALRNTIKMPGGLTDDQFRQDPAQSTRSRNWLRSPWNILALTSEYRFSEKTLLTFKSVLNVSARDLVWRNEDGGPQTPDSISPVTNTYIQREVQREAFLSSTNELRLLSNYSIAGVDQTLATGLRYFQGKMKRQGGGPGSTGSDFDLNLYGGDYEYALDFTTTNMAAFIENTFRFGKRFSVTPGFRYEYLNSTAVGYITDADASAIVNVNRSHNRNIAIAGAGMQIKTSGTTNIYANISQAYRPTDYSNQTPVGVSSKIDPNLKDANGYNADLGWRGSVKNFLNFDIGAFYMAYNNRIGIVTLTDTSGNPYTYRTNVANSVHQGLETYVEINLVKMFTDYSKMGTISFFNSFAYIDAKYVSGNFKGNWVEFAPNTINRVGITYALKAFSTTFLISNTSKSYADANNTVHSDDATVGVIPAYQIMDWSASIKIKNYNIKFGVNNLADAKYFTLRTDEYPGPGIIPSISRTLYVGFGVKF
jgi:Fe(3+) dicitrate transport protein